MKFVSNRRRGMEATVHHLVQLNQLQLFSIRVPINVAKTFDSDIIVISEIERKIHQKLSLPVSEHRRNSDL